MRVLAIESSCDETAAAVVEDGRRPRSSIVASQVDLHAKYGGIVPEVASREHLRRIGPVVREALEAAGVGLDGIDAVCATRGPGLAGALLVGYGMGKAIAFGRDLPFLGVNHLEGHVYANWLMDGPAARLPRPLPRRLRRAHGPDPDARPRGVRAPRGHARRRRGGGPSTSRDGCWGCPSPGARPSPVWRPRAGASALRLPRAWLRGSFDFSFSGLKTAVLRAVREERAAPAEIAWEFQESVRGRARGEGGAGGAGAGRGGGAAGRGRGRQCAPARRGARAQPGAGAHPPARPCARDNAAMIGAAGGHRLALGQRSPLAEDVFSANDWSRV